jgi:hypothetical protein
VFVGFEKDLHQQFVNRFLPERDLLVSIFCASAQFQPIERALARQGGLGIRAAGQHSKQRILPQLLLIIEVFVAQGQAVNPLRQHLLNRVLHLGLLSTVQETLRQARQQIQALVGFAQQQGAAVGTDGSPIEAGHDFPPSEGFKSETGLVTLCHSESRSSLGGNCCLETQLCHEERLFANTL